MIIQSLLDTDLYKFTMMQVVRTTSPARRSSTSSSAAPRASTSAPYIDEIRDEVTALAHSFVFVGTSSTICGRCAS